MTEEPSQWWTRLITSADIIGISETTVELILMVGAMALVPIVVLMLGKCIEGLRLR
tara:strand:+ start:8755 stop:8922 length:168 start_codon:yes stop_codon:yes gene_type:complete